MPRTIRRGDLAPLPNRPVPPLPHPSWSRALDKRIELGTKLPPEEFWDRLGL